MKICVITCTRADFGLLKNLILEIKKNKKFSLSILASGSHFSKRFGNTYKEIIKNKINIDEKIIFKSLPDNIMSISKVFSKSIINTTHIFKKINPDLVLVVGDRYEILASVISAHLSRIPVAHIHGGEVTHGAIDDAFRHSITKMSHIHFAANKFYKKRIIQMGENPQKIFVVGGLGIDNIKQVNFLSKDEIEKKFGFKFNEKNYLVNFHPETLNKKSSKSQIREILNALKNIKDCNIFFTMPGADLENTIIEKEIKIFMKNKKNTFFFKSLGQTNYYSFLKQVDLMIGNSSSGILEMPYFKKATINLGERQSGRMMTNSVINCKIKKKNILDAIKKTTSLGFKKKIKKDKMFYGKSGASKKIITILKKVNTKNLFFKKFFDI